MLSIFFVWLLAIVPCVIAENNVLFLTPISVYGSTSELRESLTTLFSPVSAMVSIDASGGVLNILATTDNSTNGFFSSATILSDVSSAATQAGFQGGFGPAILGLNCGAMGSVPVVAGPTETYPGVLDCSNSLTLTLATQGNPPAEAVEAAVCKTLGFARCDGISATIVENEANLVVTTPDPVSALATLRGALMTPSYMTMLRITKMMSQSTIVYLRQSLEIENISGSVTLCAERLWYLTFLILLVPILYVISRCLYRYGASKGRKSAEKLHEREERMNNKSSMAARRAQRDVQRREDFVDTNFQGMAGMYGGNQQFYNNNMNGGV